jgi:hypothetical protein
MRCGSVELPNMRKCTPNALRSESVATWAAPSDDNRQTVKQHRICLSLKKYNLQAPPLVAAMEAKSWHRIEEVFHLALERPVEMRAAFLDGACGQDAELRREVKSLLEHDRLPRRQACVD